MKTNTTSSIPTLPVSYPPAEIPEDPSRTTGRADCRSTAGLARLRRAIGLATPERSGLVGPAGEPALPRSGEGAPSREAERVLARYEDKWFGVPRPTFNGVRAGLFLGPGVGVFAGLGGDLCIGAGASALPLSTGVGLVPVFPAGVAGGVHAAVAGAGVFAGTFWGAHISMPLRGSRR